MTRDFAAIFKSVLPRRLIRLRALHGVSQSALAATCGIAVSTINEIESGQVSDVRLQTLLKICDRYRVSPDWLLGFDEELEHARQVAAPGHAAHGGVSHVLRKCMVCAKILPPGATHSIGECAVELRARGHALAYIAATFGLTAASVDQILEEEYRIRAGRRSASAGGAGWSEHTGGR